jgi:hypothetical protein
MARHQCLNSLCAQGQATVLAGPKGRLYKPQR